MFKIKKSWIIPILVLIIFSTGCVPNNFEFKRELGKTGSGSAEFMNPTDLDIDKHGNLVVADSGNTRFQIISPDGKVIASGGEFGNEGKKLQSIHGIGVDKEDNSIWVCDQKGNKIIKYDDEGNPLIKVTQKMDYPMDVAVDKSHNIYVIMSKKPEIYKFDSDGKYIETLGGKGKAVLIFPTSIIIYNNIIYVTDFGGKRIVKLDLDGNFIEEIKSKGEYEDMKGPSGLHIDAAGNLYVLDLGEVPVVILSPEGKLISQVGEFGNKEGSFLYPIGIIAKDTDDIYILDNSRNTIINFAKIHK